MSQGYFFPFLSLSALQGQGKMTWPKIQRKKGSKETELENQCDDIPQKIGQNIYSEALHLKQDELFFIIQLGQRTMERKTTNKMYDPMFLFTLEPHTKMKFTLGLVLTVTVSMMGTYAVFKLIFRVGLFSRPVNILILSNQIFTTAGHSCMVIGKFLHISISFPIGV